MECPYFETGAVRRVCNASLTHLTPGGVELEDYCMTEEHDRCSLLLAFILREGFGNEPVLSLTKERRQ